jgi:hypothetical protein
VDAGRGGGAEMIKQVQDAPGNPPYWYCIKCNTPFEALRAATSHACGLNKPSKPTFQSFSRKKND